jgi:hypothetical protein
MTAGKGLPLKGYSRLRFTNSEQAKGDSVRRQRGWRDRPLVMELRGKFAFRGTHRKPGAL